MVLVGERRAIAAAVLVAFFLMYLVNILMGGDDSPLAFVWCGAYGLAFLAMTAGYKLWKPLSAVVLLAGAARLGLDLSRGVEDLTLMMLGGHVAAAISLVGTSDLAYIKIVGERRSIATVILAFYALAYGALSYLVGPPLGAMLLALSSVYIIAFFALVAGYFWARWFAVGVTLFGVIQGLIGLWQAGPEPVIIFVGATHLFATLALWGGMMAVPYDGQTAWREKFHMDDNAVQRLGRSVIRAGVSLPMVLLYAFAPKEPPPASAIAIVVVLVALGIHAVVRMRTWGVLLFGASGLLMFALGGDELLRDGVMSPAPMLAGGFLIAAVAPFWKAIAATVSPAGGRV